MSNFGRQSPKEHSCIIISKSMHWLRKRSRLKVFSILSSGSHLVQRSGTVWAILVDSHVRNIPVKLFQNLSTDLAEEVLKSLFLFIALVAILFNVAERLSNFGRGSSKEHSCEIISKSIHWFRRRNRLKVFLFLALVAILFNEAERFEQFW